MGDRLAVSVLEAYVHLSERCWLLALLCLYLIVGDIDFRSTEDLSVNLSGLDAAGRRCIARLHNSDFIFLQGLHEQLGLMVQHRVRQGHSSPIWSEILGLLLLCHWLYLNHIIVRRHWERRPSRFEVSLLRFDIRSFLIPVPELLDEETPWKLLIRGPSGCELHPCGDHPEADVTWALVIQSRGLSIVGRLSGSVQLRRYSPVHPLLAKIV